MTQPSQQMSDVSRAWNTIASFDNYEGAQACVDSLSDAMFPVEHLDIVGSDLRSVERVLGRLTSGKAAAAGAASGAWFGLFFGLLVGLFTTGPEWLGLILGGLLIGAAWGAVFGYVGHAATGGRRDFASTQTLVASRYDVIARDGYADQARQALATLQNGPMVAGAQTQQPGATVPPATPPTASA
jgi:hypothetical protein